MKRLLALLAAPVIFLCTACGPNLSSYEVLKDPIISQKAPQKMLVMELTGDPNKTIQGVGDLYKVYFKLNFKGKKMEAPRARWPKPFDTPRDQWVGYWALPVGNEVTALPVGTPANFRIETWNYGTVAEILHKGPYSTETPTIDKLYQFISNQGYVIAEPHEEEYLNGPGTGLLNNPEKYYTIIRYVVKPVTNR